MENLIKKAKKLGTAEICCCVLFSIGFIICEFFAIIGLVGSDGDFANAIGGALAIIFGLVLGGALLVCLLVTLISFILNKKYCKSEEKFSGGKGYFITFTILYFILVLISLICLVYSLINGMSVFEIILLSLVAIIFAIFGGFKLSIALKIKNVKKENVEQNDENRIVN